jgi:hypothetical protein
MANGILLKEIRHKNALESLVFQTEPLEDNNW